MIHIKVYFSDFQKNILDFQMREHERYLRTFTYHFRLADKDNDGVLNEEQFKSLVGSLPITLSNEEVCYFLQVLDPFNT